MKREKYSILVREFNQKDLREVLDIEVKSFKRPYPASLLLIYAHLSPDTFIVAELNGKIVGYAIGVVRRETVGHVVSIAVHPEFRRMGIGRLLMKELEARLKEKGAKVLRLEVRVSNEPAIRLYRALGYRIVYFIDEYYADGEACAVMMKTAQ